MFLYKSARFASTRAAPLVTLVIIVIRVIGVIVVLQLPLFSIIVLSIKNHVTSGTLLLAARPNPSDITKTIGPNLFVDRVASLGEIASSRR